MIENKKKKNKKNDYEVFRYDAGIVAAGSPGVDQRRGNHRRQEDSGGRRSISGQCL